MAVAGVKSSPVMSLRDRDGRHHHMRNSRRHRTDGSDEIHRRCQAVNIRRDLPFESPLRGGFDQPVWCQDEMPCGKRQVTQPVGVAKRVGSGASDYESANQIGFGRVTHVVTPFAHPHRGT